jgi:D-alanine-D-alanine ligase-like ATP-grasp enzyme
MNTLKRDLKIALLLGGPGSEREVSLVSGNSVYDALCRAGFTDVTKVDVRPGFPAAGRHGAGLQHYPRHFR